MNNGDYIKAYGGEDAIIADYYKFRDVLGVKRDITGVVNPLKIDNRQEFAPIDDQGESPHCAGYSAASVVESLYWKLTGTPIQLDAHQVYAAAKTADGEPNAEGTYLEHAMNAVLKLCAADQRFSFLDGAKVGLLFNDGTDATVEGVRHLVHRYSIIQAGFCIDEGWYDVTDANYEIKKRGMSLGGHAVNIVGYDSESFFIANQWSKGFGSKGFAIMRNELFLKELMYCAYIDGVRI